MNRFLVSWMIWFVVLALSITACGQRYPAQSVELVAAGSEGGGIGTVTKMIDATLRSEKLVSTKLELSYKGGSGGDEAMQYLVEQPDNGYRLVVNTNRVILNPLMGKSELNLDDVTPIARLTTEFEVWVVMADSPYQTVFDVMNAEIENPGSVKFGNGTAIPSNEFFNIIIPLNSNGGDVSKANIHAYGGGDELVAGLESGEVDVASSSLGEWVQAMKDGKVRILVISSPQRISGVDAPTWKETGLNFTLYHWRGVFGPKNMPKDAYDYWVAKLEAMTQTQAWKDALEANGLYDAFLAGDQFKNQLQQDSVFFRSMMTSSGLLTP